MPEGRGRVTYLLLDKTSMFFLEEVDRFIENVNSLLQLLQLRIIAYEDLF